MIRIAIAGNPNSGKTTFFNALSGRRERVGNWAGVTVQKKEACMRRRYRCRLKEKIVIVDLPGAYSMDAYTFDELEATEVLRRERIDSIINVVDASNLERSLHFTMQLIETGIPVVIALNKHDVIQSMKTTIDVNSLALLLNAGVHFTQATTHAGILYVVEEAIQKAKERQTNETR